MAKDKYIILDNMNILLDYKNRGLTLDQAAKRFSKSSGLTLSIAEQYLRSLNRKTIINFKKREKK